MGTEMKNSTYLLAFLIMTVANFAMEREEKQPFSLSFEEQIVIENFVTPKIQKIGNQIMRGQISNDEGFAKLSRAEQKILEIYLRVQRRLQDYVPHRK